MMRRALLVAPDVALTRYYADALGAVERPWRVARAHSVLEAEVLVEHGSRPFDAVLVATQLADGDPLQLIERLRASRSTARVPLFLLSARGQDGRLRRTACIRHRIAGILEIPATGEVVAETLDAVERRRRVLVLDPDPERLNHVGGGLESAGFAVEAEASARQMLGRVRSFEPDLVVLCVAPVEGEPHPLDVCAGLKRRARAPRILLYGPVMDFAHEGGITDNRERADDLLPGYPAPEELARRAAGLVGWGGYPDEEGDGPRSDRASDTSVRAARIRPARIEGPPPSPSGRTRRSSRRVPLDAEVRLLDDQQEVAARTVDISPGGMFFTLDPPPSVGANLRLRFVLDDGRAPVDATGEVAWVGQGPTEHRGAGVAFKDIDEDDRARIVAYVDRVAQALFDAS